MGHAFDNGYGINYAPTGLGEVNNNVLKPSSSDTVSGLNSTQQVNTVEKMSMLLKNQILH